MTGVRTRDEAIASVDRALQAWSTEVTALLTQARAIAHAAKDAAERVVRQCATGVAAAEAVLAAAGDDERRGRHADLVRAREAHEQARRASVRVGDVAAQVARLSRSHSTGTTPQVAAARAQLSAMSRALEGYRAGGGSLTGGGAGGRARVAADGSPLTGLGLTELDVSAADLDETPVLDDDRSADKFGKGGLRRADYRWAVQTWNDTVGPGVAGGKSREDFAARDTRSNARPLRRTADVYDMFLGTDRIRADRRPDGTLNVVNGRHRLLIARELGITRLPGEVS